MIDLESRPSVLLVDASTVTHQDILERVLAAIATSALSRQTAVRGSSQEASGEGPTELLFSPGWVLPAAYGSDINADVPFSLLRRAKEIGAVLAMAGLPAPDVSVEDDGALLIEVLSPEGVDFVFEVAPDLTWEAVAFRPGIGALRLPFTSGADLADAIHDIRTTHSNAG